MTPNPLERRWQRACDGKRALDGSVIISVCVCLVITVRRAGAWSWSWSMCCRMVWFSIRLPQSPEHLSVCGCVCVCSLNHRGFRRMCPLCWSACVSKPLSCCSRSPVVHRLLIDSSFCSCFPSSSSQVCACLSSWKTLTVVSSSSSACLDATASVGVKAVKPFVVWLRRSAQNQWFCKLRVENQSIWFLFSTLKTGDRNQISWATLAFFLHLWSAGLSVSWKNGKIMSERSSWKIKPKCCFSTQAWKICLQWEVLFFFDILYLLKLLHNWKKTDGEKKEREKFSFSDIISRGVDRKVPADLKGQLLGPITQQLYSNKSRLNGMSTLSVDTL